jgi:hypothetical protein
MNEPRTCGEGIAERSALPSRMSALSAAIADNLERHRQTLDLTDDDAKAEHDAYTSLVNDYRNIALQLQAAADRMAGYRGLPMARHDAHAFTAPEIREALAHLVQRERDLVALLTTWIEQDQVMLTEMSRSEGR